MNERVCNAALVKPSKSRFDLASIYFRTQFIVNLVKFVAVHLLARYQIAIARMGISTFCTCGE